MRLIPITAAGALLTGLVWAVYADIDQISRAPGQVVPAGRTQIIQSADGGVIDKIFVKEGDLVKRGQLLVTLDSVKLVAAVAEGDSKVASLKGTLARIEAELFDRLLKFPAEVDGYPDVVANQRMLYIKRREALGAEIRTLNQVERLTRQELDMTQPLLADGDVSRTEILRLQRTLADVSGQIANRKARYVQDLQTEYARVADELVTAEQSLAQRKDSLAYSKIVAPTDGVVKNVRLTTVGGVLRPGDEVMQIVPTGEELIVEARVAPSDIAFVRTGQSAGIKFDAYDASIYGTAQGKVTYVSPDTLTEQRPDGQSMSFYRAHITVNTTSMHVKHSGEKIEIQPGMTATAEIKTGDNTVFRYLTKPIAKTFSDSLSER
jgi:adhesin transport system membrane fusion protein